MRRVFNWDGRKGGAGMEDLPSLISSAIEATLNNTEAMRVYAAEKADKLGRIFSSVLYVFPSRGSQNLLLNNWIHQVNELSA